MRIKLLQWNVWEREDLKRVARVIADIGADVVVAQELVLRNGVDSGKLITQALDFHKISTWAQTWDSREDKKTAEGVGIFCRWPIINDRMVELLQNNHNGTDSATYGRRYIEGEIRVEKLSFKVGTAHLSFMPQFTLTPTRIAEQKRLLDELKKEKSHFIFGADLNELPESDLVRQMEENLVNCGPQYSLPSFPTKPFEKHGGLVEKPKWRLDFVFATPDVRVISAELVQTDVSDHLPVLVEMEI
jgi:endonuclease/exonuclease/phosphatase family metal-dependent hydrolase